VSLSKSGKPAVYNLFGENISFFFIMLIGFESEVSTYLISLPLIKDEG
jgi:hypothetical protein